MFRDKTVLLPCDDPEWSNFTLYFAQHFQTLGLKKLISTSYAPESKKYKTPYQPSLFEQDAPQFDPAKTSIRGKIFVLDHDIDGDGRIDFHDLEWRYLEGDGDFRSLEVTALRDEGDIIVTNPPFSLFREFLAWIVEVDKKCLMIGNTNAITYKEVFPLIKDNKLWLGATGFSTDMVFGVPEGTVLHGNGYAHYDNYDAIEVPYTDAIPSDYDGAMGVPITFLDKYCPDQFEILGATESEGKGFSNGLWHSLSRVSQPLIQGSKVYKRIFTKKIQKCLISTLAYTCV